jgi:2-polyprenyl-3-methyl-5-hydroxy-6-metoxy-1,4-benzoquinol methylase
MRKQAEQNKTAWEYRTYENWCNRYGNPSNEAERILQNPTYALRHFTEYFPDVRGLKIANPCGSHGRIAVALAVQGAEVTVFDISEGNRRYATELAECAGVSVNYFVGDFIETNLTRYGDTFDIVFSEGGVLHYFDDIDAFMRVAFGLLKPSKQLVLNDFHPFRKINTNGEAMFSARQTSGDYFDTATHKGDVAYKCFFSENEQMDFPDCILRFHTIGEIINAVLRSGFSLCAFDEVPNYSNPKLPGLFTLTAKKNSACSSDNI